MSILGQFFQSLFFRSFPFTIHCLQQHRITFQHGTYITVPAGTRLDNAIVQAGYALRTPCGGAGTCGKCLVNVLQQNVLACQTIVESDLDVTVPDTSLRSDEQNVVVQTVSEFAVSRLPSAVSQGYGIALDIGTTTLAAELHDFSGTLPMQIVFRANPQRIFGDDVMTRIQKIMEDETALTAMQRLIVKAINEMIAELTGGMGIAPYDVSMLIASGNTVMQSIFFGIDPSPLGASPFRSPVNDFPVCPASEIGLTLSGTVGTFPIFGGFVGGDIVAGMLAVQDCSPKSRGRSAAQSPGAPSFLLDIGTNGEIVLSHSGKHYTAATAAGPAFEGAKITCGTLAVPGAVDHVDFIDGKVVVSTIGHQPAVGICGSGLIDAAAVLLERGVIEPSGRFADKASHFELVSSSESGLGEAIVLTQRDIRELQLAAGAIRAGIMLLLQEHRVLPEDIETFYLAGGFGQFIRTDSAKRIGLFPSSIPSERFQFCGNTSLAGARAMLLNPDNARVVRRLVEQSQHCELATLPQFQEVFAESMCWL